MRNKLLSKQLLSLLLIVVLLTGFSYGVQPGRLELNESNVMSVSVDNHNRGGGYRAYQDAVKIRAAVQTIMEMKEVARPDNRPSGSNNPLYNVRINFKDGSARTYFVEYFQNGTTVYLHPTNTGYTYEVSKATIDPLLIDDKPSPAAK